MSVVSVSCLQAHSTKNNLLAAPTYCGNQDSYLSEDSGVKINKRCIPALKAMAALEDQTRRKPALKENAGATAKPAAVAKISKPR